MSLELKYDQSLRGAKMAAKSNAVQFQSQPGKGYGTVIDANAGDYIICTGYYFVLSGYAYAQSTEGWYAVIDLSANQSDYWTVTNNAAKVPTYSDNQANKLIQQIINNNISILRNNLLCARYADRFTAQQQQQIKMLQKRLQARNNALQAEGLCTGIETGYPEEYAELSPYLERLMTGETVGVATWVVVVIAAAVIAGFGTAAYFTYKSLADESEKDVKFSKELTATLVSKLTEEEYQQLLNETKGLLTKSKIKSLVKGYSGAVKTVAFVAGATLLWMAIQKRRNI